MDSDYREHMREFRKIRKQIHINTRKTLRRRFKVLRFHDGTKMIKRISAQKSGSKFYGMYVYCYHFNRRNRRVRISTLCNVYRMRQLHVSHADINRMVNNIISPPIVSVMTWSMKDGDIWPMMVALPKSNPLFN